MTQDNAVNSNQAFLHGIKDCISVSLAGGIFGFVFGVLAHAKGLSLLQTLAMSALVYAGAAQMVAISMWSTQHLPTLFITSTAFIICLRFILMGMTLRQHLQNLPKLLVYPSLHILIDENWALTIVQAQKHQPTNKYLYWYFIGSGILFYLTWQVCSVLGNHFASYIVNPHRYGFDFAFPAIFLALLVSLWRGKHDIVPWLVAAGTALTTAYFIPGNWYIIAGALAGSFTGVWRDYN